MVLVCSLTCWMVFFFLLHQMTLRCFCLHGWQIVHIRHGGEGAIRICQALPGHIGCGRRWTLDVGRKDVGRKGVRCTNDNMMLK